MSRYIFIYSAESGIIKNIPGALAKTVGGKSSCALCNITHGPVFEKSSWTAFVKSLGSPTAIFHKDEIPASVQAYLDKEKIELPVVLREDGGEHFEVFVARAQLESCSGDVVCLQSFFKNL